MKQGGDSDLLRDAVQRLWSADIKTDEHSITVWIRQGPYIIIIRGPCGTQAQWEITLHYDKDDVQIKEETLLMVLVNAVARTHDVQWVMQQGRWYKHWCFYSAEYMNRKDMSV